MGEYSFGEAVPVGIFDGFLITVPNGIGGEEL